MSHHRFRTKYQEQPVVVVMGWDRPLGYHFMTIENLAFDFSDGKAFVYSNMEEGVLFSLDLDHFRNVLKQLDICVPESMFTEALADQRNNVGNRNVEHQADGTMVERGGAKPRVGEYINLDEISQQDKEQVLENNFGTVTYRGTLANVVRYPNDRFRITTFEDEALA